jgi:SAM-dependent methyltransferase
LRHEFRSFWLGERISPLEYLCIQSFLSHGHRYVLYTYGPVAGLPPGCELADARQVLPEERVFVHSGAEAGSPAGFANLFRYKLLRDEGGWWVDADVLCRRAELPESEYVFASEAPPHRFNNAILRAPKGSALMSLAFERALELGTDLKFGTTGALLLTAMIDELGLRGARWKKAELYPWSWPEALAVLDRAQTARLERLAEGSVFCHFWTSMLARYDIDRDKRPPRGSLLDRLYDAYEVPIPAGRGYTEAELIPHLAVERRRLVSAVRDGTFDPAESVLEGDFEPMEHYLRESGLLDRLRATIRAAEQLRGRALSGAGADVAAGCLWAIPHLLGSGAVERIYAVERSRHRLQTLGLAVLRHYGVPVDTAIVCAASLSELGLPDHCLDFVFLSQALHPDHELQLLAEVRRLLAPDGVALVIGEPMFEARVARRRHRHLLRETAARALPRWLQRRTLGRVLTPRGWRLPDRWVRDPTTGDHSYPGSTYAQLFARAGFVARQVPDVEHSSRSFVLRPS